MFKAMIKTIKTSLITFWHAFKSGVWLKSPIFWARFMAYAIPIGFLLYVLYMNFLPFGYNKTFTIDVGSENDTKVGEFYLEPSKDLSERETGTDANGKEYTYRELNGVAYAVFKPNAVLKNAEVTVSVEGEGVSIIPPVIDFKPEDVKWDYSWDFTKEIPKDLTGNAFMFDGEATFNGRDTRLELPNSENMFEDGPFTVYAEWTPKDNENNAQQIVGHFNWELWQNKDSVEFRVGRMNDANGNFYSIKYPLKQDFFNGKHFVVMSYNPSANGYIDLYVDGNLAGRTYFGEDKIWKEYGKDNISFGWSKNYNYGKNPRFVGSIYRFSYISKNTVINQSNISFDITEDFFNDIPFVSNSTSTLNKIIINVKQK